MPHYFKTKKAKLKFWHTEKTNVYGEYYDCDNCDRNYENARYLYIESSYMGDDTWHCCWKCFNAFYPVMTEEEWEAQCKKEIEWEIENGVEYA